MSIYGALVVVFWLGWIAYWVYSASGVKETAREENPLRRLGYSVLLWIAAFLLVAQSVPLGILNARFIPERAWLPAIGTVLVGIGIAFSIWARVHLGTNWSARVTVKQDHALIRSGPYGLVRHPIYTGLLAAFIGTALLIDEWRGVLAVALVFVSFWIKLRLEERWMEETFGTAYADYRSKVAALIPFML